MDAKKSTTDKNIPIKHLKETSDICCDILTEIINNEIKNNTFPDELKLADITPIHKRGDATRTKNYRPVSVLPPISKVFENFLQKQIYSHVQNYLSPFLCGYRKGYSTQHALLSLIENWKLSLDRKGYGGSILMDLSKAFDTINYDLLLAKLHAYGFDESALKLIKSYLTNRWQRTKINTSFSSWSELLQGVPQGSVLGPLLFNIYINDLFFIIKQTNVCNYADDTTLYACNKSLNELLLSLEHDSMLAVRWFENNYMKLNEDKCHFIISGHKYEHSWVKINENMIWESSNVKLLGVNIDSNLTFNDHESSICAKTGRKLTALRRLVTLLNLDHRRILMKSFIESQFNYCPLVWMFHNRTLNSKIDKLQERALRIVYQDNVSSFEELLKKDNSARVHQRNLKTLATEIYKIKNNLSPQIIQDIFPQEKKIYTLRNENHLTLSNPKSVSYGIESLRYLGPKIWNMLPDKLKQAASLSTFKAEIKTWIPTDCPCKLCKLYVPNLGYI